VRPLRFLAASLPLFLAWEYLLRQPYLLGLAHLFAATARLFRLQVEVLEVTRGEIHLAYHGVAWSDQFGITGINVVAFVSLVLATGGIGARRRLRMLGLGLAALVATQVLGLWTDIVHVHLHDNPATASIANGLRAFMTGFGTFLFPLLIWLVLVRDRLPLGGSDD
jgi:hypothetical protein